jgi:hypothetical protein
LRPNDPRSRDKHRRSRLEASALGPGSYPIEVAVVDCESIACRTWLIRPTPEWLANGIWSDTSAKVHKIPISDLVARGEPAKQVATELASCCSGKTVLCDGGEHDWRWLVTLYAALDQRPPLRATRLSSFRMGTSRTIRKAARARHRPLGVGGTISLSFDTGAGADARRLAEPLRLIAGYP